MTGKAIYAILNGAAGVTAITSTRIYPDIATQGAVYPFLVYMVNNIIPTDTKDGVSQMDAVQVVVTCYASTYASVNTLAKNVRTALDRKAAGTYGEISIQSIRFENQESASMHLDKQIYIIEQVYSVRENR